MRQTERRRQTRFRARERGPRRRPHAALRQLLRAQTAREATEAGGGDGDDDEEGGGGVGLPGGG